MPWQRRVRDALVGAGAGGGLSVGVVREQRRIGGRRIRWWWIRLTG